MHQPHSNPVYDYVRSSDQDATTPAHHTLIIVGAGPVGLAAAIDATMQGIPTLILDDNNTVSVGSRSVCTAKRAIEILDRLGCGQRMVDKGITWNLGKVFFRNEQVYQFNLLPEQDHQRPAFINLQQYYVEEYMVERAGVLELLDLRWNNRVIQVQPETDRVQLQVQTPEGTYPLSCDYLTAADGANSTVRDLLGLESKGQVFQDRFLIADVIMQADFPTERWFWFDPPFHEGQSTLLHRQADNVFRIDFQLGWDADPEEEKKPERVIPRVKAMLGAEREFELEWTSVYTFQCRRMERFRHGRVLFVGDAAHQVSPFGARGANSGFQDTDNLIWKLKLVLEGNAPDTLLDSYDEERGVAADENILNSTRSTDFITPKNTTSRIFRDATLLLAAHYPFARTLVNSGRLSVPTIYHESSLNTPDTDVFAGPMAPGTPSTDAPITTVRGDSWWLRCIGNQFKGLYFATANGTVPDTDRDFLSALVQSDLPVYSYVVTSRIDIVLPSGVQTLADPKGLLQQRFDGQPGTFYLLRPDQHIAGRWRVLDLTAVLNAVARSIGQVKGENA